jgi:uncharacterized membrane protein YfcA
MDLFAGISLAQAGVVAAMALFGSLIGGIAGYGTGALMPLVLVPIAGAEMVVPTIAISSLFSNLSRALAFRSHIAWRPALLILACAVPTCVLGAYGFTLLTGRGVLIVIGSTLILSVPLRRFAHSRGLSLGTRGLAVAAMAYGFLTGGTTGAGVILLSLLMSSGLQGGAVIATDAVISIVLGLVKVSVFGVAGVIDAKVVAYAIIIGTVAFPGAFIAKLLVERMPVHFHTALLDAVVVCGGGFLIFNALTR